VAVSVDVKIEDDRVRDLLTRIQRRMADLTPAMKIIGETVRTSVIRNFEVGGRPRWKPLSPVTKARRKGDKILMRQGFAGGLAGSIHAKAYSDRAVIGTNKIYAAVHQFGAKKGSFGAFTFTVREHMRKIRSRKKAKKVTESKKSKKGKKVKEVTEVTVREHERTVRLPWGDIPARPFLMVQDEDWEEIREALLEHIMGGTR